MHLANLATRVVSLALAASGLAGVARAAEPGPTLTPVWQAKNLRHQPEASAVAATGAFVYTGGGAPDGKVAKLDAATGAVTWTHETHQTYQPSHPVSNGKVVVFGTFYHVHPDGSSGGTPAFVGLDDGTGEVLWRVPAASQNMAAACFAEDLVFAGSYDACVYAIEWATGRVRWKTKVGGPIRSAPCVVGDLVAIGCYDGLLHLIDCQTGRVTATVDCGGRVESDVVGVGGGGLVLVAADAQAYADPYSEAKLRKTMLVVDVRQAKVVARFPAAAGSFDRQAIVAGGDRAYFFDDTTLYAFDAKTAAVAWQAKAPEGLTPFPLLTPTRVVLAFNRVGHHGDGTTRVVGLDPATGRAVSTDERGGIGLRHPLYNQTGAVVVTADPTPTGYSLAENPR